MSNKPTMTFDGAGYIKPVMEGYVRKGGQNAAPANNAQRPPAPPPFRPAPAPSAPVNTSNGNGEKK